MGIIEAKAKLNQLTKKQEINRETRIPFYLEIQQTDNYGNLIYLDRYKRVEATQACSMNKIIKKDYPELKGQEKDLFAEFFTEFLNGEIECIYNFMDQKGFKKKEEGQKYSPQQK